MVVYLDNTIYTNHALTKICENIAGDYSDFHFIVIRIGSGDSTLDQARTDISEYLYTLRVKSTEYADGVLTIRCEIPPELADIPITEIGLYDRVYGIDYLFSYSKVEIIKPADLNYELTVVLNLGPKTIDFPGVNVFKVNNPEYATRDELDDFLNMVTLVHTDLERIIKRNADRLGLNKAEVAYERELGVRDVLNDNIFANIYYTLYNKYGNLLSDLFFIEEPNYLAYNLTNFADSFSSLDTYLGLYSSENDHFTFHDGPVTFLWSTKLNDITTASTIINKRDNQNLYFSIDIVQNYEIFKIEKPDPLSPAVYDRALYNEMVITLYGSTGAYQIKYYFDNLHAGKYLGQAIPYVLTFNGSFTEPEFHLYVDGVEVKIYNAPTEYDSLEEQAERKESDLYGKCTYGNAINILNMPDYSNLCPLKNYLINSTSHEKTSYYNALGNKVLLSLKKEATKYDVAYLSSIVRSMGENG